MLEGNRISGLLEEIKASACYANLKEPLKAFLSQASGQAKEIVNFHCLLSLLLPDHEADFTILNTIAALQAYFCERAESLSRAMNGLLDDQATLKRFTALYSKLSTESREFLSVEIQTLKSFRDATHNADEQRLQGLFRLLLLIMPHGDMDEKQHVAMLTVVLLADACRASMMMYWRVKNERLA